MRLRGEAKLPIFTLSFAAHTRHAWLARLARARRTRFGRRTARVLLADFWYFWSHKSTTNEKLLYDSSRANNVRPYHAKPKYSQETKEKIRCSFRFFFCTCRRKRKSYQKENAEIRFRALRSATTAVGGRHRLLKKAGENLFLQKLYKEEFSGENIDSRF